MISHRSALTMILQPGEERTMLAHCLPGYIAETTLTSDPVEPGIVWMRAVSGGQEMPRPHFGPWTLKWTGDVYLTAANESGGPLAAAIAIDQCRQEDIERFFGALQTTCVVPVADLRDLLNALRPDPRDLADYEAKADSIGKFRARWPGEDWTQDLFNTRGDYAEWLAMERQVELWRLAEPLAECLPKEATPDAPR